MPGTILIMTKERVEKIKTYLNYLRHARYSTGVMHIAAPAWLEDLRWCVKIIDELLAEVEEGASSSNG